MIRYKETAEDRIRATAVEELGAEVVFESVPIVEQIIEPDRRLRGHLVALLYKCRLTSPLNEAIQFKDGEPQRGQWAWHACCPENIIAAHKRYCRLFA
jgi:colanic acid biosynthesis protein WcaH